MKLRKAAFFLSVMLLLGTSAAHAREVSRGQIDELARDVGRVEAIRDVKDLQRYYAQYAQFGLWDEMAALFADDAAFIWGDKSARGPKAIASFLKQRLGGKRGLSAGAMHSEFIDEPLINLSADGFSAEVRWMGLTFAGDGKGTTLIEGGLFENEYVLQDGKWLISVLHFYPQYIGDYAGGWSNAGDAELPQIPFHFTVDESGTPIPEPAGAPPASDVALGTLEARIAALNAEDEVRNLQNAYGYYVDQKMWDDVVDLFDADGVVEISGAGLFPGKDGIRRAMERMGEQGLSQGQFNEHPSFDVIVTVMPGAREAYARGMVMGMRSKELNGPSSWEFSTFRNRFVKEGGLWKIREMRIYPTMVADYADGWGHGGTQQLGNILPAFIGPHPTTGADVAIVGFELAGTTPLTDAAAPASAEPAQGPATAERLLDAQRRLARSQAFDGVVNVSSAYGYYLDDFFWNELGSIFAKNGNKHSPFAGFYLGQDRIKGAATAMYGAPPPTRKGISFHWRTQPVIHVSHDGRSANLRTRLFQPRTAMKGISGSPLLNNTLNSGMYPNDQAVLENGVWRLWSLTIDEHYMSMENWKEGWAGVEPVPPGQGCRAEPAGRALSARHPDDRARPPGRAFPRRHWRDAAMARHLADVVPLHEPGLWPSTAQLLARQCAQPAAARISPDRAWIPDAAKRAAARRHSHRADPAGSHAHGARRLRHHSGSLAHRRRVPSRQSAKLCSSRPAVSGSSKVATTTIPIPTSPRSAIAVLRLIESARIGTRLTKPALPARPTL